MDAGMVTNDPRALMQVLSRRKGRILLTGLLFAVVAWIAAAGVSTRYAASGLLVGVMPSNSAQEASDRFTETDILRSRALLIAVSNQLHLASEPGLAPKPHYPPAALAAGKDARAVGGRLTSFLGWTGRHQSAGDRTDKAVDYLAAALKISGEEGSRALTITLEAGTPDVAASVVNEVMRQYVALDEATRQTAATDARHQLLARAEVVHQQAIDADTRLKAFQSRHDVLTLESGPTMTVQLGTQEAELAAARLELSQALTARSTNRDFSGRDGNLLAFHEMQISPVMQALALRETDVQQRIGLARQIGFNNPKWLDLQNELRTVRDQIAIETHKISTTLVHDVQADERRVALLQTAVDDARANAQTANNALLEFGQLTREAESRHSLYQTLLARAEDNQGGADPFAQARIASPAVPSYQPKASRKPVIVIVALLGGMLLAASLVLARHLLRARVPSLRNLETATGLPGLGSLPHLKRLDRAGIADLAVAQAHSPIAETLRGMRLALQNRNPQEACSVVLVTSSELGEGKTSFAVAMARRAARDGLRVLLVEADMHLPCLAQVLTVTPGPSLEAALLGDEAFEAGLAIDVQSGLDCLLSRGAQSNPFALLSSKNFGALVAHARKAYDLVVIDSPPALRVSDPVLLSRWSDIVLFVVRADVTPLSLVIEALDRFPEQCRSRVMTVLTHARTSHYDRQGTYGGYHNERGTAAISDRPRRAEQYAAARSAVPR